MNACVVVPWVTEHERRTFLDAWCIDSNDPQLVLQRDEHREGCGATKNKGVHRAMEMGADVVVVLDGDCYPSYEAPDLATLIGQHVVALEPQHIELFEHVTYPPSRGTPYVDTSLALPVAASMGFWLKVPDYCAVRQLAFAGQSMTFLRKTIFGRYFPLCGMNIAFRPASWWPWCQFIEVSRFDDIWAGWLWQKEAYRRGYCFNLNGPFITHVRQSNVWSNLIDEAVHLETTETLWRQVAMHPSCDYSELLKLLPVGTERLRR